MGALEILFIIIIQTVLSSDLNDKKTANTRKCCGYDTAVRIVPFTHVNVLYENIPKMKKRAST